MKTLSIALLATLFSTTVAPSADPPAKGTPEGVITAYFEKIKTEGFGSVGGLMHPDELDKFKGMMLPIVKEALAEGGAEAEALFGGFADKENPKELADVTGEEFMNLFLAGIVRMAPQIEGIIKNSEIVALGHVNEGEVSHVVVRMKMETEGIEIEQMSVLSVKMFEGEPRMMLTGEMKGMAEAMKRQR